MWNGPSYSKGYKFISFFHLIFLYIFSHRMLRGATDEHAGEDGGDDTGDDEDARDDDTDDTSRVRTLSELTENTTTK